MNCNNIDQKNLPRNGSKTIETMSYTAIPPKTPPNVNY